MTQAKLWLALSSALALVACGGGSGSSSVESTFSGKVIDGYIENAIVCVDLNSSLTCDPGEPSTRTDASGSYTLTYNGASPVGLPILAIVAADSKDEDDKGLTLEQAGKSPFNLASPISSLDVKQDVPVTPLTTLVAHQALAGATTAPTAAAIKDAETQVKRQLGITQDILGKDVTKDVDLHKMSQVVSVVLGDITKEAKSGNKAAQMEASTVLMRDILPAIVDNGAVKKEVVAALNTADRTKVAANLKTELNKQVDYSNTVTGSINNIALSNKLPSQEVANVRQILADGVGSAEVYRFNPVDPTKKLSIGDYTQKAFFSINFQILNAISREYKRIERFWYSATGSDFKWVERAEFGTDFVLNSAGKWVEFKDDFNPADPSTAFNGNCLTVAGPDSKTGGESVCVTQVNLGGKSIVDFAPELCDKRDDIAPPASCKTATFASGSLGLNLTATRLADQYKVNIARANPEYHYGDQWGGSVKAATTIQEFIDLMVSQSKFDTFRSYIWEDFSLKFKSFDKATGIGEVTWFYKQEIAPAGEGKFSVKTINGQQILTVPVIARYHKVRPGDMVGEDFIFAAVDGKIRFGTASYASAKATFNFGTTSLLGNNTMLNSLVKALGIGDFPYSEAKAQTVK